MQPQRPEAEGSAPNAMVVTIMAAAANPHGALKGGIVHPAAVP